MAEQDGSNFASMFADLKQLWEKKSEMAPNELSKNQSKKFPKNSAKKHAKNQPKSV